MSKPSIAIILPPKELYTPQYRGAVALCMTDFTRYSRYREQTVIYGSQVMDLPDLHHATISGWQRWYWRDSYAWSVELAKRIRQHGQTLVEVQNRPLIFGYLARMLKNEARVSLHLHNDPQGMKGCQSARQRQFLLNHAAAVYCVSAYIRERFVEGLQQGLDKVHVVHNGLDTRLFQPQTKQPLVMYAGRIIREKGALPLAEAFASIAGQVTGWNFLVCGVDRLEATSEYERLTHGFLDEIGKQCQYTGYLDHAEVMQRFASASIAVVPSVWQEPFGRTALEAMAAGTALITSGSGGIAEVVGDAALIVPPRPDALADALLKLIRNSELRQQLQLAARLRAESRFDIRLLANQLDDLRDHLLV